MCIRAFVVAMIWFGACSIVQAAVTDLRWQSVDGDPTVAGSVQNSLVTSLTADWTNAVITVKLTAGQLLNPVATGTTSEWRMLGGINDSWLAVPSNANGG